MNFRKGEKFKVMTLSIPVLEKVEETQTCLIRFSLVDLCQPAYMMGGYEIEQ